MDSFNARYSIGDLVRCIYDVFEHYYPPYPHAMYEDDYVGPVRHGIITDIDYALFGSTAAHEIIYVVLCTDRIYRFYAEDEVIKIS